MRALTLTQPWCGLVASGRKLVENRPRHMIKREDFGVPFALHASREIDQAVRGAIYEIAPELHHDLATTQELALWHQLSRITSAVIAVATIARVVDEYDDLGEILGDQYRWFFGPVAYVLHDVRALPEPVPCRGWQGFWTLPHDIEAQVTAGLESTPALTTDQQRRR